MSDANLSGRAAIAGIGQTEFSKESGRTELQLACESVLAAVRDAGLEPGDVDGLVTFTMDTSEEMEVARNLGMREVRFFSRVSYGGGASAATIAHAAMAVAAGMADVVVSYRAFNERSGNRFGNMSGRVGVLPLWLSWYAPYGLMTPAAWVALYARPYMERYGVTNADFGRIAVVDRSHAATNPDAWFYERPITLEDHQSSRWIVEPVLRLLDCCQESDGGVAIVVTSAERARDLPQPPAIVTAAAQGATFDGETMTSYYKDDLDGLPEMGVVGRTLWEQSALTPADVSTAFLYDHFTPFVLMQLEELGFCARGEAKDWATIERLSIGGELPINTSGGLLGEAYIHGMNGITEVVRQIRGTAVNQVADVEHALVTAGTGVPTSGLILSKL
ncbi:MAG: lipid-transfer protein [Actinobacteria bacterium]|nr:lipid-transfer protein [Actinomycetota bacterium]